MAVRRMAALRRHPAAARALDPALRRLLGHGGRRYRRRSTGLASLGSGRHAARVLVIDNYDSFTFNLVQYLGELGADPVVHRHDDLRLEEIVALDPDGVLVSPGPARPTTPACPTTSSATSPAGAPCSACASDTSASARCSVAGWCGPRR